MTRHRYRYVATAAAHLRIKVYDDGHLAFAWSHFVKCVAPEWTLGALQLAIARMVALRRTSEGS